VLRRIFGPKREEDGSWRKLNNDELHGLCSSLNIIKVIKSRVPTGSGAHPFSYLIGTRASFPGG